MAQIDLELERECPGYWSDEWTEWIDCHDKCPECNGTGRVPTNFGQEILDFVRNYDNR